MLPQASTDLGRVRRFHANGYETFSEQTVATSMSSDKVAAFAMRFLMALST